MNVYTFILVLFFLSFFIPYKGKTSRDWPAWLIVCVALALVCLFIGDQLIVRLYPRTFEWGVPIKSLKSDAQLHGSFFLGSGRIDQEDYYFTFVKEGSAWRKARYPSASVWIKEDNDQPCIWCVEKGVESNRLTRFFLVHLRSGSKVVGIIVPVGTIIGEFKL